jgi:plastocyanin
MAIRNKTLMLAFGLGIAGLIAAGCGSSKTTTSPTTAPTTAPSGSSAPTLVTVNMTDFHLALSTTSFSPGRYTFNAVNKGGTAHSLTITGPGVNATLSSNVNPGASGSLTVALQAGSYELFCPVDGHKGLGMDTQITVGSGAGSSTGATSSTSTGSGSGGGY